MSFTYKDLTYIRVALKAYEGGLLNVDEDNYNENEFSDIQEDIQYLQRLKALTDKKINEWENSGSSPISLE